MKLPAPLRIATLTWPPAGVEVVDHIWIPDTDAKRLEATRYVGGEPIFLDFHFMDERYARRVLIGYREKTA